MKVNLKLIATCSLLTSICGSVLAQGTAFTYQGWLNDGGNPANGSYDLAFTLFATNVTGTPIAGPVTNAAVSVSNGLFTATVDFGNVFTGASNWLEIAVSSNDSNTFTTLTPRQPLTPVPYALVAANVSGPISANALPDVVVTNGATGLTLGGAFSGDGSGLSSVNAYSVNGLTTDSLWKVGGNAGANPTNGAFLGTTDNLPLEFWVNTNRALRLEYAPDPFSAAGAAPNIIGGYAGNVVSNGVAGAFIGGGGDSWLPNVVGGSFASILGGHGNQATSFHSVCIGDSCVASAPWAIAMGVHAHALHEGSFVWADSSSASFSAVESTADHQFLLRAAGGVGIGTATPPPGGLNVASGGLAVSGASSPNYPGAKGVFIEKLNYNSGGSFGVVYAYNYADAPAHAMSLCLNSPGGNVGIGTINPLTTLHVIGNILATGVITPNSDRNLKTDFAPVDAAVVLEQVARLPIQQWRFKTEPAEVKHFGPMAQDFRTAFGLGEIPTAIATVDADGVALAAIQGLNEKVEGRIKHEEIFRQELEEKLQQKETEIGELRARLEKLEQMLAGKSSGG